MWMFWKKIYPVKQLYHNCKSARWECDMKCRKQSKNATISATSKQQILEILNAKSYTTHYDMYAKVIVCKSNHWKFSDNNMSLASRVWCVWNIDNLAIQVVTISMCRWRSTINWPQVSPYRTCERKEWQSIRTVWDISRDDRARTVTCSLRTATERQTDRQNYSRYLYDLGDVGKVNDYPLGWREISWLEA